MCLLGDAGAASQGLRHQLGPVLLPELRGLRHAQQQQQLLLEGLQFSDKENKHSIHTLDK